jgi:hypothetical protein
MGDPEAFLARYYRVQNRNVYVLGSFARRVTLYSQQVRALNLIFALQSAKILRKGTKVAVIGGGAAGLTAAVAAARAKANVWIFDRLQGPMELQQNNRQRWLHPFIYDWPYLDEFADKANVTVPPYKGDDANLPLLTWSADYAANVAQEIVSQWDYYSRLYDIEAKWNLQEVRIRRHKSTSTVAWQEWTGNTESMKNTTTSQFARKEFSIVILAVGFGLERPGIDCDSYWIEDNLDAALRTPSRASDWLVSGKGDGAFTDLMRLCFRRYRQDEILNLLTSFQGIDGVIAELRAIDNMIKQWNTPSGKRDQRSRRRNLEAQLSRRFEELPIDEELLKVADGKVRRKPYLPSICLATKDEYLFGSQTSVLNRLGVLVLHRLNAFTHLVGKTSVSRDSSHNGKLAVAFKPAIPGAQSQFDRALTRHGTHSALKESFITIWRDALKLRRHWKMMSKQELVARRDETRQPQWSANFFGPEAKRMPPVRGNIRLAETVTPAFANTVRQFGVWAKSLSIHKAVRSDGSANITYTIEGLRVNKQVLHGVYFYYKSSTGIVDRVVCAPLSPKVRLSWKRRNIQASPIEGDIARTVDVARHRARILSGIVTFNPPLKPKGRLSFSLSFRLINGDALTSWDFKQMYSVKEQKHIDKRQLTEPVEYLTRTVWFPVKTLKMRITLPTRVSEAPWPGIFRYPAWESIKKASVINTLSIAGRRKRILRYYPAPNSKWVRQPVKEFHRQICPPFERTFFRSVSPGTWELAVSTPNLGSCYSLEWRLPKSEELRAGDEESTTLELGILKDVRQFRKSFLRYRTARKLTVFKRMKVADVQIVRGYLRALYQQLRGAMGAPKDDFVVSLMVYDEQKRRLIVADGIENGSDDDPSPEMWDFWLPYGLGLAGSCFRSGRGFAFEEEPHADGKNGGFDTRYYLSIPGRRKPKFLIAIPLHHPNVQFMAPPRKAANRQSLQRELAREIKHFTRAYADLSEREPSRQCIGVVNITTKTYVPQESGVEQLMEKLEGSCRIFCWRVYDLFIADGYISD